LLITLNSCLKKGVPFNTTITGTGEDGTTITLDIGTCTNAPVTVTAGVWSCDLSSADAPQNGDTITATSTDVSGNMSTGSYTIANPSSGSSSSKGGSVKFICSDPTASNYNDSNFGRHKQSLCEYDTKTPVTTPVTTLEVHNVHQNY
jgi:hypothetical protein